MKTKHIIEILNKYKSNVKPLHNEGMLDCMDFHKVAKEIMVVKMKILKCGYISEDNIRCEFIKNKKECKFHDYCKYQRTENNYCDCDHDGKEVKMIYVCKVCNREIKISKTLLH